MSRTIAALVRRLRPRAVAPLLVLLASAIAPPAQAQQVEYYHLDALGSVRAVTDDTGKVLERHDYLPYGEECTTGPCSSNAAVGQGQPKKFTGKERDSETALDYFGARYYASSAGRFTTVDPVHTWNENVLDPQRWNRYAYARDNPLRYNDPDGRVLKLAVYGYRVGRALYKGYDVYSTVEGIAQSTGTIFSGDANVGTGDRLLATGSLLMEISGASDVLGAAKGLGVAQDALNRGRKSEDRVLDALGETKNKRKVSGSEGDSIPDYQNPTTVGEIKDREKIYNTRQIRIQREAAESSGREHVIHTRTDSHVSRNVERGATRIDRRPDVGSQ